MPEVQEQESKTTVPVGEASYQDYKDARSKGLTAVPAEVEPEKDDQKEADPDAPKKGTENDPKSVPGKEGEPKKESKGGGFQRRIDKLTRHAKELEAELERVKASGQQKTATVVETGEKPSVNDVGTKYKTYEDYIEALADWKTDQKLMSRQAEEQERVEAEDRQATFDAYQKRVTEAVEKYDDFEEVVTNSELQIPQGVELAVVELENGPDVAYYLGKHPEICEKLCEMRPLQAIAEIGKISDKLSEGRPAKKLESKTEKPIVPVGKSSTKSTVALSEMSYEDYKKARQAGRTA